MGTWGTAISSNDTYADAYAQFHYLYNDGYLVEEITKRLIAENQETINSYEDCNNFWFAFATQAVIRNLSTKTKKEKNNFPCHTRF
jgi:hypothetical protein